MNKKNIDIGMYDYIKLLDKSDDGIILGCKGPEHVVKNGLLRKILNWLGLEITYKD